MLGEEGLRGLPLILLSLFLYLIPTVVAFHRQHHNRQAIGALNLLLGWTVIGWIAALIWALTRPPNT